MTRLPAIELLLGCQVDDLEANGIQRLVEDGVAEGPDLEFKVQCYGTSDSDKRELAKDVAALANAQGGLIIVGVKEQDGVAVGVSPVEFSDAEVRRMNHIILSGVAPRPDFGVRHVMTDKETYGFYLIAVPQSPQAPHAVLINDGMRYPRRTGTTTHMLSESEVANAYRNRFAYLQERRERHIELSAALAAEMAGDTNRALLTFTFVPDSPGSWTIDGTTPRSTLAWLCDSTRSFHVSNRPLRGSQVSARPRHRRIVVKDSDPDTPATAQRNCDPRRNHAGLQRRA